MTHAKHHQPRSTARMQFNLDTKPNSDKRDAVAIRKALIVGLMSEAVDKMLTTATTSGQECNEYFSMGWEISPSANIAQTSVEFIFERRQEFELALDWCPPAWLKDYAPDIDLINSTDSWNNPTPDLPRLEFKLPWVWSRADEIVTALRMMGLQADVVILDELVKPGEAA